MLSQLEAILSLAVTTLEAVTALRCQCVTYGICLKSTWRDESWVPVATNKDLGEIYIVMKTCSKPCWVYLATF